MKNIPLLCFRQTTVIRFRLKPLNRDGREALLKETS